MRHQTTRKIMSFQNVYAQLYIVILILLTTYNGFSQTTYNITNPEDLTSLSATLAAGDTVILANGTYTSNARIKFSPNTGTASMPITYEHWRRLCYC